MNFFSSTLTTLAFRFTTILFGTVTGVITARALGPSGRGQLAVILSTISIAVMFGQLGLTESNAYFVAGNRKLARPVAINSLWSALILGTLTIAIVSAVYYISPEVFELIPYELLLTGLLAVPFLMLGMMIQRVYLAQNRIILFNSYELTSKFLILGATVVVLSLLKLPLREYLLVYAGVFAVSALTFFRLLGLDIKPGFKPDMGVFKQSISYGFRAYIAVLLPFLLQRVGLFFVNAQSGADQAGFYSVAMQANDLFLIVPGVIGVLLVPRVAANQKSSDLSVKTFKFTAVIMTPVFILAMIFTNEIVSILFGGDYLPAVVPMRILFIGGYIIGIGSILLHDFSGRGFPMFTVLMWIPFNVINVLLNTFLVPSHAATGAAASITITYGIAFLVIMIYFVRLVKLRSWSVFLLSRNDFRDLVRSLTSALSSLRTPKDGSGKA